MKPSLGDVIAEKYRLERVLGEGGMSTVFAASNVLTGKQVAIKWLNPEVVHDDELCQRLLREAKATSAIDPPNVVNVFDVAGTGRTVFGWSSLRRAPVHLLTRTSPARASRPMPSATDEPSCAASCCPSRGGRASGSQADNIFLCVAIRTTKTSP